MSERTRTLRSDDGRRPRASCAYLHLVIEAARPRAGGTRHCLLDITEVELGRGTTRSAERGDRKLAIKIPDEHMSSRHAVVRRDRAHWIVEDLGSKNGLRVNGAALPRAILRDGDLVELGRSFLRFRASAPIRDTDDFDLASDRLTGPPGLSTMLPELAASFDELARIAPTQTTVLVHGSTGTGKELIARAVHSLSRRKGAFVPVNCGALPASLVESELFGYRKGAFSGATEDRAGLAAASEGGTLFLDEIGDLPAASQAALLRLLEEREVRPVGATTPVRIDLRVVAATHRDLAEMIEDGEFREDLLARLSGFVLPLPPLAARREDLGLVIAGLLDRVAPRERAVVFGGEAMLAMLRYEWPRNMRELVKCLERAVPLAGAEPIRLEHLPPEIAAAPVVTQPLDDTALSDEDRTRKTELVAALETHGGNISEVARVLGRTRPQIQRWIKRFGIDVDSLR